GIEPVVVHSGVDESSVDVSRPDTLCVLLAWLMAQAVAEKLRRGSVEVPDADPVLVLGGDSVFSFQGEMLGKPAGPAEAVSRWRRMRGRHGELYTGHA